MYTGAWLRALLVFHRWIAAWSSLIPFAILYFVRCRRERMMLERFGDAVWSDIKPTGRVLPRPMCMPRRVPPQPSCCGEVALTGLGVPRQCDRDACPQYGRDRVARRCHPDAHTLVWLLALN